MEAENRLFQILSVFLLVAIVPLPFAHGSSSNGLARIPPGDSPPNGSDVLFPEGNGNLEETAGAKKTRRNTPETMITRIQAEKASGDHC